MTPEDVESIKRKCESPFVQMFDFREDIALLIAENERLRSALLAVKADRPTAHSDAVWAQVLDALGEDR